MAEKIDLTDATEAVVKEIVFRVITQEVAQIATAGLPFLAWPVINPVFMFILNKLATLIFNELSKMISFAWIDSKTWAEKAAYLAAVEKLKAAQLQKDEVAIEKAKEEFKKTLRDLIRVHP